MNKYRINLKIFDYIKNYAEYLDEIYQLDIHTILLKKSLLESYITFVINNPFKGKESTEWGYNLGNGRRWLYQRFDDKDSGSQWYVFYNITRDKVIAIHYLLHNKQVHKAFHPKKYAQKESLRDVAEFFSWMKRLDEVKGARPTFWC